MKNIAIITFFENELKQLIQELELYKQEENIWKTQGNISNSAGNLTLHLIGNLHTFIGKELGRTDYVRDRELEFSDKNISRIDLIISINQTVDMIKTSLNLLSEDDLKKDYPLLKFSKVESTEYLLIHLLKHFSYHLGQINYHRRLIDL